MDATRRFLILLSAALLALWAICGAAGAETILGGWEFPQGDQWNPEKNAEAKAAFEKATEELVGVDYELIACVGEQVVQGMNYCLLCKATVVYPDAESKYVLVTVYQDLDGSAEITDIQEGVAAETTCALSVRKGPGTGYDAVGRVRSGASVRVYGVRGNWALVKRGKLKGWLDVRGLKRA